MENKKYNDLYVCDGVLPKWCNAHKTLYYLLHYLRIFKTPAVARSVIVNLELKNRPRLNID